jgi:cell division protein FtsI (penicillin-binding protein 3)
VRPGPDPRTTRWIAIRIGLVAAFFAAGLGAVTARAFSLQVLRRDRLDEEMAEQVRRQVVLKPRRGVVTDRTGVPLAVSADAQSLFADPTLLAEDPRGAEALRKIGAALRLDARAVRKKLARGSRFVWIARRISPAEAAAVGAVLRDTKVRGLALLPETRRYYPKLELASQLLGLVGEDGEGLEGIELARDEVLRGEPGRVPSLRDGRGRVVLSDAPSPGHAQEGARVELTIDQGIQLAAERALAGAVSRSRAAAAVAVALDPATGEVLAMATHPPYNPNAPRKADELRNRAVTDSFEPGSTMKTFAIAGALERGALRPLDPIDCSGGRYAVGAHVIRDHEPLGWAGAAKILAVSSNVGAAKIGARLGRQGMKDTFASFGLGEKTGIGLPGEVRGQIPFPSSDVALATQSFGYNMTASALQVTNAMAALANGGELMRPIIVRRVVDVGTGEVLEEEKPEVVRRAVSEATAATLRRWLAGVVEDPKGTGRRARPEGYRVAGKTGTARKIDPVGGGYAADRHLSSFVGFAPAGAPRIVVGVFVDEPRGDIYGGEVAAPAFREIVEYALARMGVPPEGTAVAAAPPVAAPAAPESEIPPPVEVGAPRVARPPGGATTVPALAGLPARSAIRLLEGAELAPELAGAGRVVSQSPPAGKVVERGTRVRMRLAPAG